MHLATGARASSSSGGRLLKGKTWLREAVRQKMMGEGRPM